jgi:hypothetical protein
MQVANQQQEVLTVLTAIPLSLWSPTPVVDQRELFRVGLQLLLSTFSRALDHRRLQLFSVTQRDWSRDDRLFLLRIVVFSFLRHTERLEPRRSSSSSAFSATIACSCFAVVFDRCPLFSRCSSPRPRRVLLFIPAVALFLRSVLARLGVLAFEINSTAVGHSI